MKISYLITCCNETTTLENLLSRVFGVMDNNYLEVDNLEEEIVLLVDCKHPMGDDVKEDTAEILRRYSGYDNIIWETHPLNNDYGVHKNYGIEQCTGDWIFQIDGDELPPETLLRENLKTIIESNPDVELIYIPRINDFKGVTEEHAKQWGWYLSESLSFKRPIVNWNTGDYQGRIFKKDYPRIHFEGKLHEKIVGHNKYSFLPKEEEYALYHDKTIEKQVETNLRYNKDFTKEENMGKG